MFTRKSTPVDCPNQDRKHTSNKRNKSSGKKRISQNRKQVIATRKAATKICYVSIEVDGKRFPLTTSKLADENYFNQTLQRCHDAKKSLVVDLTRLLEAAEDRQVLVADFLVSVSATKPSIRYVCGDEYAGDLLSAVLLLIRHPNDPLSFSAAKKLALRTAALQFPTDLPTPCNAIVERCRKCGMKGESVASLIKQAGKYAHEIEQARRNTLAVGLAAYVRSVLQDAPVADDIVVPPGWSMSAAGVQNLLAENMPAIDCPVVITSHGTDGDTGEIWINVAWLREGKWSERTVQRAVIADNRKIIELANYGLAVTSQNVSSVVAYLADFETANLDRLSKTSVTRRLGYHDVDGETAFLLGTKVITARTPQPDTAEVSARPVKLAFQGADAGDAQIVEGLGTSGSTKGWRKAIAPLASYPRARLFFYAPFAAMLLKIVRAESFILENSGPTTTGKTSAARVAASVIGNPSENQSDRPSVVFSWNSSRAWIESAAATLCDLIVILDECHLVRNVDDITAVLLSWTQGRGRGRGSLKGCAKGNSHRGILISTGERSVADYTTVGGVSARVVSIRGLLFGDVSPETEAVVNAIRDGIADNYGHAGLHFAKFLLNNQSDWKVWRREFREIVAKLKAKASGNNLLARKANHLAVITLAARLAHKALKLPFDYSDPIDGVWDDIVAETRDRTADALAAVVGWAVAHPDHFAPAGGNRKDLPQPPSHAGWAGRWQRQWLPPRKHNGTDTIAKPPPEFETMWLGFMEERLRSILQDAGFDFEATVNTWRDRGWLLRSKEKDRNNSIYDRTEIGGTRTRVIKLKGSIVNDINNGRRPGTGINEATTGRRRGN